jgi:hypothetical protein
VFNPFQLPDYFLTVFKKRKMQQYCAANKFHGKVNEKKIGNVVG